MSNIKERIEKQWNGTPVWARVVGLLGLGSLLVLGGTGTIGLLYWWVSNYLHIQ